MIICYTGPDYDEMKDMAADSNEMKDMAADSDEMKDIADIFSVKNLKPNTPL